MTFNQKQTNDLPNIPKYITSCHPYRPVWYVPDQGQDYTILYTYRIERV